MSQPSWDCFNRDGNRPKWLRFMVSLEIVQKIWNENVSPFRSSRFALKTSSIFVDKEICFHFSHSPPKVEETRLQIRSDIFFLSLSWRRTKLPTKGQQEMCRNLICQFIFCSSQKACNWRERMSSHSHNLLTTSDSLTKWNLPCCGDWIYGASCLMECCELVMCMLASSTEIFMRKLKLQKYFQLNIESFNGKKVNVTSANMDNYSRELKAFMW